MASGGYWKSRPTLPGEMGDKEKAALRTLAAKPMIEQSIAFTTISAAMNERLDDNQFRSPNFQRKRVYKQVKDLPEKGKGEDAVPLTEEQIAAIRAQQSDIFRQRELTILRDHTLLCLGVLAHLWAMHLAGDAHVSLLGVDMAHAVKLLGTTPVGATSTALGELPGTAVPASWAAAYAAGALGGCAHLVLLGKGVKAVGAQSIVDAAQGAAGGARQVLIVPLAAASKHYGQAVLPFPLIVCGYLTYQLACLFHAFWENSEDEAEGGDISESPSF